jgi:FlaA1/EpsC-like NDP-sugar epimerase
MKAVRFILGLKSFHRPAIWCAQNTVFVFSGVAAFLLRFDLRLPTSYTPDLVYAIPIWLCTKVVVFRVAKLDRGWWQYVSAGDIAALFAANCISSALGCIFILLLAPAGFPRSLYPLELMICFLGTAGIRLLVKVMAESAPNKHCAEREKNTLIYGAGNAGVSLVREIQRSPQLPYQIVGFLDDFGPKSGSQIMGIPVLGAGDDAAGVARRFDIDMILIAIPSATGAQMTHILERCRAAGVQYKTIPGLAEMIAGHGLVGQIREVAVEDLLGRRPVKLDDEEIHRKLSGKLILVTGAAGSIGSELCRQIARFEPAAIVGLDIAESPLFEIDGEMKRSYPRVPFHPEIGSIRNRQRLNELLRGYSPSIIFHAAAYKHVPMMEEQMFEAIENNVIGTYNLAMAANTHGVSDFILISSDKAVRPTNIMGATKRVAELLLLALQNEHTRYIAVRFGNVLGSNGSVIPTFKRQIAAGGPVTVTHPEMQRYFMTIREASQLVLQASSMGRGGEVFVLDMGTPVKIVDLARNLILLSGLQPGKDIKIEFTGIRPGEKLFEELSSADEDVVPTRREKIRIFCGNGMPLAGMESYIEELRRICENRSVSDLVLTLKDLIPEYNPSKQLIVRIVERHNLETAGQWTAWGGVDRLSPPTKVA